MSGAPNAPAVLALLDVGPVELLVVALAAIMLFGGDLPDIARRAGRTLARWRAAANELARSIEASGNDEPGTGTSPPRAAGGERPAAGGLPPGEPDGTPPGDDEDPHGLPGQDPDLGAPR